MEREVNQEKRNKFMEFAGKRVNNVLHDIQILEPMARSNSYDFTKQDIDEMFSAIQETLEEAKEEFYKKFEEKTRATKKVFTFGSAPVQTAPVQEVVNEEYTQESVEEENKVEDVAVEQEYTENIF